MKHLLLILVVLTSLFYVGCKTSNIPKNDLIYQKEKTYLKAVGTYLEVFTTKYTDLAYEMAKAKNNQTTFSKIRQKTVNAIVETSNAFNVYNETSVPEDSLFIDVDAEIKSAHNQFNEALTDQMKSLKDKDIERIRNTTAKFEKSGLIVVETIPEKLQKIRNAKPEHRY